MLHIRYRRPALLLILGLALFVFMGGHPECGTDTRCIRRCDREAKDRLHDEKDLHKDNTRECRDSSDEVSCLQDEAQRHLDALKMIATDQLACVLGECGGFADSDDCLDLCDDWVRTMTKDEDKIHNRILEVCEDDDDDRSGDPDCESEMDRHEDALAQIQAFREDCEFSCEHEQGGGHGGQ